MTSFSQLLFNNDPSCCYRNAKRSSLEINLLENALYALYALVLTWICYIFNNMKGVYISFTLLSIVVANIYSIKNIIAEKEHDLDISTDSDSSLVSETDESQDEELQEEDEFEEIQQEDENESSILEDFKKVVNDTSIYEELESETVELSPQDLAIEYDRVADEYMNIERIIQNVAAEYREKASAAREAAETAREAELSASAADEREYNED